MTKHGRHGPYLNSSLIIRSEYRTWGSLPGALADDTQSNSPRIILCWPGFFFALKRSLTAFGLPSARDSGKKTVHPPLTGGPGAECLVPRASGLCLQARTDASRRAVGASRFFNRRLRSFLNVPNNSGGLGRFGSL